MPSAHLSKALTASHCRKYFEDEYISSQAAYYSEDFAVMGQWRGALATELGLVGPVEAKEFFLVSEGVNPRDGTQMVEHRKQALAEMPAWVSDAAAWRDHFEEKLIRNGVSDDTFTAKGHCPARVDPFADVTAWTAPKYSDDQRRLIEMNEKAAEIFASSLAGSPAQAYLEQRKVSGASMKEFRLGYSEASGTQLRDAMQEYGRDMMLRSGLFFEDAHTGEVRSLFRDRLMFPIQDAAGNVIAFAGRRLDEGPAKYINSRSTEIYDKSEILYNAHRVATERRLVTVEGYMDVIAAHTAGVPAVATCGTAFSENHAALLKDRFVVINTDQDARGKAAALRQIEALLPLGNVPRIAVLSEKDAAQSVEESGPRAYRRALAKSMPAVSWVAAEMRNRFPEDRAQAARESIRVFGAAAPGARVHLDREVSAHVGVEPENVRSIEPRKAHRAGWDLVFDPPKTVSITALVGGDDRIRIAHRESVQATLDYVEPYVQARIGGNFPPETTGKALWATFEHDTSRPEKGYPSPQIHTHCILFNVTERGDGSASAIQPREIFRIQKMMSEVYRAELMYRLRGLGYELERTMNVGLDNKPQQSFEIRGYTREFIEAESPRRQKIVERMRELGLDSARAAEIVAQEGREGKIKVTPQELRIIQQAHAADFGVSPEEVVRTARGRAVDRTVEHSATESVRFSKHHLADRLMVFEHSELVRNALRYGFGHYRVQDVESEIAGRVKAGELEKVQHVRPGAPGARYRTARAATLERSIIQSAMSGQGTVEPVTRGPQLSRYEALQDRPRRREVIEKILATTDQTVMLQGAAGAGKSTSLRIIGEIAREHGFEPVGLGPTGKAASNLAEIGVPTETLQRFLAIHRTRVQDAEIAPRYFFLDEGSLVSTKQMGAFFAVVRPQDRVLIVGDDSPTRKVGQHHSVEAGRIFHQLQEAGVKTAQLNEIMRQKEPWLLDVVRHFRNGRTEQAVRELAAKGRVEEFLTNEVRYYAIAQAYTRQPDGTLVITPDNQSRLAINGAIRDALRRGELLTGPDIEAKALIQRDPGSKVNLQLASTYKLFDTVRYLAGDGGLGVRAKDYAAVIDIDRDRNTLTVATSDGRRITYDPRKHLNNVAVYDERKIMIAVGERVQVTAPYREKGLATRDSGTVREWDGREILVAFDNGKTARWKTARFRHFDHAYAMTSQAAQSVTVDRTLVNVNTGDPRAKSLLGQTYAYVAGSRPRHDLLVFTNNAAELERALKQETERHTALSPGEIKAAAKTAGKTAERHKEKTTALGMSA